MQAVVALKVQAQTRFVSHARRAPQVRSHLLELQPARAVPARRVCAEDLERVENIVYARRRVKRGEALFSAGDEFSAIYAIRSGFFKTSALRRRRPRAGHRLLHGRRAPRHGRHRQRPAQRHRHRARGQRGLRACPTALIEQMAREFRRCSASLHAVLAREIVRDHGVMMLLGTMRAEERLAAFLLNLSQRFVRRGYSLVGLPPAHDARGDRQLPRPQARDREPALLASSRRTA